MKGLLEEGGGGNASTRVADKVGWPVNWWPTLGVAILRNNPKFRNEAEIFRNKAIITYYRL